MTITRPETERRQAWVLQLGALRVARVMAAKHAI